MLEVRFGYTNLAIIIIINTSKSSPQNEGGVGGTGGEKKQANYKNQETTENQTKF